MHKKAILSFYATFIIPLILSMVAISCASIQNPTGGPLDKTPPKVLKAFPADQTKNFNAQKIEITLDEYFKLANEYKEISISPALERMPNFKVNKKTLEIKFQDSLEKNTTYTINFGKAIADYNAGNLLKGYSYVFSTGPVIDSLSISGNVTNVLTAKPEFETTVVLVPSNQDTLFKKKKASIFALTDSSGNFTLHNLRPGDYKLFALKESTGSDRIYNSSQEEIGFVKDPIHLQKDTGGFKLTLFKEIPDLFRFTYRNIEADGRLRYAFNRPVLNPSFRILEPAAIDAKKITEFNKLSDTATVWLPKTDFDSVIVELSENGKPLDTLTQRRNKTSPLNTTITVKTNVTASGLQEKQDLLLTFSTPIDLVDGTKFQLLEDSIEVDGAQLLRDSSTRILHLRYAFKVKKEYIIKIAENAITGINGGKNKAFNDAFLVNAIENYAALKLSVTIPDTASAYIIELLRDEKEVLKSYPTRKNTQLVITKLPPGTYKIRVIYDANANQQWDTGNLSELRQPEQLWNYSKSFTLRSNQELIERLTIPPPK